MNSLAFIQVSVDFKHYKCCVGASKYNMFILLYEIIFQKVGSHSPELKETERFV